MATVAMLEECLQDIVNNPFVASVNDPMGESSMAMSLESP